MTDYARINLIGKSREELRAEIAKVREWGGNMPVYVSVGFRNDKVEDIDIIEKAVNEDLAGYVEQNFGSKRTVLKTGGNDDLFLITNPNLYYRDGGDIQFRKLRHKATNITPKKKKRRNRR